MAIDLDLAWQRWTRFLQFNDVHFVYVNLGKKLSRKKLSMQNLDKAQSKAGFVHAHRPVQGWSVTVVTPYKDAIEFDVDGEL